MAAEEVELKILNRFLKMLGVEAVPHILPPHCKARAFYMIMLIIKTMF